MGLTVEPIDAYKIKQRTLLVKITEDNNAIDQKVGIRQFDESASQSQYIRSLEIELKQVKEKLESAYLQVDATNENMQSFNEELLSANEEMQSTNEEMQSVNEELQTINSEYQLKNKELQDINDDLNNYFRSNVNGQLFVDNDLNLMKFSPGTVKQINLLPTDIGRPLSNISTNIKFETLTDDIKDVIENGRVITKEIETLNNKWYQVMTMPYVKLNEEKHTGAIVTFNDISELKRIQIELDIKNQSLKRINEDLDNFVNTASHDLLAPLGNIEVTIDVMNSVKVVDQDLKRFLDIINNSVKKFRILITEISKVGKLENEILSKEKVDVDELVDNIEWSLDHNIKASGAIINRDLNVKHILFSKKNLRSIIYNLISNGIKFNRGIPHVVNIQTLESNNSCIIIVEDNGTGITKENIDKLFIMYNRFDEKIEGHGIGLYLARKIINASGGSISVDSKPGEGTKFTIQIPMD